MCTLWDRGLLAWPGRGNWFRITPRGKRALERGDKFVPSRAGKHPGIRGALIAVREINCGRLVA